MKRKPGHPPRPSPDRTGPTGTSLWWARLPVLAWALWTWIHHLGDAQYQGIAKGLNLALHEIGHAIFGWFGDFPGILGGSFFQCLCPGLALLVFRRQGDRFGMAFCFAWLGTNLYDVAMYIADARAMELPLVSPFAGDEILHDWNWILGKWGWLAYDQSLAGFARALGSLAFLVFLVWGSLEIARIRRAG
ncbi:MAG: hypothetical protein H6686_03405 [Fibrobacteria bacterium]|nr:hypothetical protein [Fibrobacteria bacterium]